ncbi:MAG TPA: lipid-A-disaccharide synthase [Candidatus Acidoferrales bacterium]|nr:lipid-A-disaccharide synthase [Candidatus Acidoferrales bacterium]
MPSTEILISAGEISGDTYAAQLALALVARTRAHLFGMGGERMREAGVELIANASEVTVSGVSEVLAKVPALRRTLTRIVGEAEKRRPRLAILTDFPGFHLRLARMLKSRGVPCVYFIAPQFWAWRPWRARLVKRRFKKALCIFPFEVDFYRKAGVDAEFIGHPLVDFVKPSMSCEQFLSKCGLDAARPVVALLPGSRHNELRHNLPELLASARQIAKQKPDAQFLVALAPGHTAEAQALSGEKTVCCVGGATYDAIASASVAVVASGTATVETALLGTPMVVVYRVAPVTSVVLRVLVTTPYFAMPNLIAGRRVVPELFQSQFNAERVADETICLLRDDEARRNQLSGLAEVRARLGPGGAIERAAEIIANML